MKTGVKEITFETHLFPPQTSGAISTGFDSLGFAPPGK
jgi:hypothetical protein